MKSNVSLSDLNKIYDKHYFERTHESPFSRIRKTVLMLGDVEAKRILDLGCGTAEGSVLLRRLGARVVCLDFARFATVTCFSKGFDGVLGVVFSLPFRENSFDGVLFMDVIEHVPRAFALQTLFEIKRVTKPEGRVAIHTMPHLFLEKLSVAYGLFNQKHWRRLGVEGGHINTYTPWRLEKEIRSVGLTILRFNIGTYPANAPFSTVISPLSQHLRKFLGNDFWVCCSVPKDKDKSGRSPLKVSPPGCRISEQ